MPEIYDPKQIQNIVREVLKDALGKDGVSALVTPPATRPLSKSSATQSPASGSSRKLADENIARWLGRDSSQRTHAGSRTPGTASVPSRSHLPKIKSQSEAEAASAATAGGSACADKNLIPSPRHPEKLGTALCHTPARIGVWRTGTRYLTRIALKLRADHAVAKDAVYAELKPEFATTHGYVWLTTKAKSKEEFLLRPDLGRQLDDASLKVVQEKGIKNPDIQITVADGLSSWAAERYAAPMVKELQKLCQENGYSVGTVFCVKYSRIAIQDVIGETVNAKISIILLGERPGLGSGDSLSNYMVYGPKVGIVNAKKSMISNIHPLGHKPQEAAGITVEMFKKMFEQRCSGVDLHV